MDYSSYINKKFNHLTIKEIDTAKTSLTGVCYVVCECDCGSLTKKDGSPIVARLDNIVRGYTKSCGCIRSESAKRASAAPLKDSGLHKTEERLYIIWQSMIQRCHNPNKKFYELYGGRGISVCKTWRNNYLAFRRWALNNGYDPEAPYGKCTLDRIDNNKDYKPSNCRWVDMGVQNNNKVNTILYSYRGVEMNARGWSDHLSMDYKEVTALLRQGLSIGKIIKLNKNRN